MGNASLCYRPVGTSSGGRAGGSTSGGEKVVGGHTVVGKKVVKNFALLGSGGGTGGGTAGGIAGLSVSGTAKK